MTCSKTFLGDSDSIDNDRMTVMPKMNQLSRWDVLGYEHQKTGNWHTSHSKWRMSAVVLLTVTKHYSKRWSLRSSRKMAFWNSRVPIETEMIVLLTIVIFFFFSQISRRFCLWLVAKTQDCAPTKNVLSCGLPFVMFHLPSYVNEEAKAVPNTKSLYSVDYTYANNLRVPIRLQMDKKLPVNKQ